MIQVSGPAMITGRAVNVSSWMLQSKRLEETISSDYAAAGVEIANRNETVSKASSKANLTFVSDVTEYTTIKGHIPVHFKAALAKGQGKNFQLNALLVDVADEGLWRGRKW